MTEKMFHDLGHFPRWWFFAVNLGWSPSLFWHCGNFLRFLPTGFLKETERLLNQKSQTKK